MKLSTPNSSRYLVVFACTLLFAQQFLFSQEGDLVQKAKQLVHSDPDEAIKIAEHLLKSTDTPQDQLVPNVLLANSYFVKGQYQQAIIHAFEIDDNILQSDTKTLIELNILKSKLLNELALYKQAAHYLNIARVAAQKQTNFKDKTAQLTQVTLQDVALLLSKRDTKSALNLLNQPQLKQYIAASTDSEVQMDYYLAKSKAFNNLSVIDSADVYIKKALQLTQNITYNNIYKETLIYSELENLLLKQRNFKESEMTLFIAMRYASVINNPSLLMHIYKDLSVINIALNKKSQYKVYNDEFLLLRNQIELMEQESINTLFNKTQLQDNLNITAKATELNWLKQIVLAACFVLVLVCCIVILKSENRKKRLKEIINYLEISRTNFLKLKPAPVSKPKTKSLVISEETEQALLAKLNAFENSTKFLNKDMSLSVLAGKFETNTRYLSEVINKHYNDNFNTFINKLRIDYIIKKLQHDSNYVNYKISYLAEECGFSSHSNFTTVFKTIVGMSPATFINLIKKEQKSMVKKVEDDDDETYTNQDVA
ncbi:helix-turn-helix domain-containing protein [Formosa sp. A9]|uniref:helix-turn-helix domain-containing protein n=1 Tax=Formosa sp. A9 TaxID=3442641 RepID=UPI003EBC6823